MAINSPVLMTVRFARFNTFFTQAGMQLLKLPDEEAQAATKDSPHHVVCYWGESGCELPDMPSVLHASTRYHMLLPQVIAH